MIDIIIVGYPKSGNTWVTRLVAELVGCPVVGFLNSDHNEIAREGLHRKSDYQCFKSHHQFHELLGIKTNTKRIIYVVRDPRDICISGSNFFYFERWPFLSDFIKKLPRGHCTYKKIVSHLPLSSDYRIKQMMHAVLYGSREIHEWVRIPWVTHYRPYIENQCFFVKYEDILCEPERESKRILMFLGLNRDPHQIKEAIEKQSFKNKKNKFLMNKQVQKANFMRAGKKEQWRQGLSKKHNEMFKEILTDDLNLFGYPTD